MSFNVQINVKKFDDGKLRLSVARSMLSLITGIMLEPEAHGVPSQTLGEALHGVEMFLNEADKSLNV